MTPNEYVPPIVKPEDFTVRFAMRGADDISHAYVAYGAISFVVFMGELGWEMPRESRQAQDGQTKSYTAFRMLGNFRGALRKALDAELDKALGPNG